MALAIFIDAHAVARDAALLVQVRAEADGLVLYDPPSDGEWVALDCKTTGLDAHRDQIISIAAVRIVVSRPLVGYFLEFDVAMLNREIWPLLGVSCRRTSAAARSTCALRR